MSPSTNRPRAGSPARRGRLKPMRVSAGFRAYVLDQLAGLGRVHARSMFGGIGLYADDVFFGIVAADTVYFKVNDSNGAAYDAAGMPAFKPYTDRPATMSYRQVPVGVLEDAAELARWAGAAIRAANTARERSPRARRR